MASFQLRRVSSAPILKSPRLPPLRTAYSSSPNSAERALPIPSEDVQRDFEAPQEQRIGFEFGLTGPESLRLPGRTLGSEATNNQKSTQDPAPGWKPLAIFNRLLGRQTTQRVPISPQNVVAGSIENGGTISPRLNAFEDLERRKVDDYPAHSIAQFAALLNSNDKFCIFRRFGPETARILEIKNLQLDQLARKINEQDDADAASTDPSLRYRLASIRHSESVDEAQLNNLAEFEKILKEYYDLLLKYFEIRALNSPSSGQYSSVYSWVWDRGPLAQAERKSILRVDDLVIPKTRPANQNAYQIEDFIETWLSDHPESCLNNLLRSQVEREITSDPKVVHLNSKRLDTFARVFTALLGAGTMLIPVFVIFLVEPSKEVVVSIVAIFVTLVMVAIPLLVEVTPHDLFLGMAAYSAVLVALLSSMIPSRVS